MNKMKIKNITILDDNGNEVIIPSIGEINRIEAETKLIFLEINEDITLEEIAMFAKLLKPYLPNFIITIGNKNSHTITNIKEITIDKNIIKDNN